jgi:hypothetical protein
MKPKAILDTNVCGKLVEAPYKHELPLIRSRIARMFQILVSPNSFLELLDAIKGGTGEWFENDRERLRVMAGGGIPHFLPLPVTFSLQKVLGLKASAVELGAKDFKRAFNVVMRANNRDELFGGQVRIAGSRQRHGIDPDLICEPQKDGDDQHVRSMQQLREKRLLFPSPTDGLQT